MRQLGARRTLNQRTLSDANLSDRRAKASEAKASRYQQAYTQSFTREISIDIEHAAADERESELHKFETGALQAVTNVDLFDEGFDVPAASCAIMARPTQSLAKFLQMIGRVLRPVYADGFDLETRQGRLDAQAAGPKPFAVIIDPVRNWERHGMPNWPRRWTLAGKDKGSRGAKSDAIPQKVCTACTQPYEAFYKACPFCGHTLIPAGRARPEQVDGDLVELDVEGMAALVLADAALIQRTRLGGSNTMVTDARTDFVPDANGASVGASKRQRTD